MGRIRLVELLCERLTETQWSHKSATGIAITGGWGTGKSWVLEHVKNELEQLKETHHIICIDFKPWLYGETDMTKLFYQTLENVLKSDGLKIEELRKILRLYGNRKYMIKGSREREPFFVEATASRSWWKILHTNNN